MKAILNFSLAVASVLSACTSNDIPANSTIEIGRVCGWCAGQWQIGFEQNAYVFQYDNPCDDEKDVAPTAGTVDAAEWEQLLDQLNVSAFLEENHQSCAVCADGCDYWIKITHADSAHELRFTSPDDLQHPQNKQFAEAFILLAEEIKDMNIKSN